MYGLPKDVDWSFLVGLEVAQVCIDPFNLYLSFHPQGAVNMQCGWLLRDADGAEVDRQIPHDEREAWRIHRLLGKKITGSRVQERLLELWFEGGFLLAVPDDSEQYETFSIQFGDLKIFV